MVGKLLGGLGIGAAAVIAKVVYDNRDNLRIMKLEEFFDPNANFSGDIDLNELKIILEELDQIYVKDSQTSKQIEARS